MAMVRRRALTLLAAALDAARCRTAERIVRDEVGGKGAQRRERARVVRVVGRVRAAVDRRALEQQRLVDARRRAERRVLAHVVRLPKARGA